MQSQIEAEKKAIKIGVDGRVLQDQKPSGIPYYALSIINELIRSDKNNRYTIFFNSFRKIEQDIPKIDSPNLQYKIYHFPNKFLEWFWKIIPLPKIDRLLDVDIFFSPHFIQIPLSKKVKKVITIHDLSFVKNKRYFSWRKNLWHWQMNPRKICQKAENIIAVSNSTKRDLVNIYNIPEQKIKVIYNGQEQERLLFSEKEEHDSLNKFNLIEKNYLLFLATLEPRKNIDGVIEAFNLIKNDFPEIKLVIAGKKGWLFDSIFEKIKKNSLEGRVIFTDFITNKEKEILMKNTTAFVFPSFCEGFGIPIIEAKGHGIPIITSSTSSLPEIIKDAAILINPHNTHDIAQSIKMILSNNNLREKLRLKESELPNFSWSDCARKTLDYLLY